MPTAVNIAMNLKRQADERPYATAIFEPTRFRGRNGQLYERETFASLWNQVSLHARVLESTGITPGMRVALMVPPSVDFVVFTFALMAMGAVPVFVDPGIGIRHLGKCLDEAAPEAFIGIAKAQWARRLLGWARRTLRIHITAHAGWAKRALWNQGLRPPIRSLLQTTSDDTAAILFTSGSTGVPKGAVYTHGMFQSQLEMLQETFHIEPGEVDLCTFPLFALFGPALGMTSVIPEMDARRPALVNPLAVIEPIRDFGATNLFGSPALLNRVRSIDELFGEAAGGLSEDEIDLTPWKCSTLKRVLSAGAPVAPAILERFSQLLAPGTQIYTPYGATEALPVAVIGSDEVLQDTRHQTARGAGTCVGRPVAGLEVRIIRISDAPIAAWSDDLVLPPGEIGEIAVYGPQVTQEYFRRPDLTALAKIPDATRGRKWHRMGDVGYFDEQGRLWFCGRKSQRVITSQRTYFTEPVEGIFNTVPGVFRTALVGVKRDGEVRPVLCAELERGAKPQAAMRDELLQCGTEFELTRDIRTILFHPRFPVDIRHNSKIFREKLAVWAAKKSF